LTNIIYYEEKLEKKEIHEILEYLENGTEINIGIIPDTKIVKYGYDYINNELILYLQGFDEVIDIIKNYVKKDDTAHFLKWGKNNKSVSGDGKFRILENEDDKLDGLNKVIKQHNKNNVEYDIAVNNLNELFIFEINVENTYLV
jgi:hypothetical protein